MRPTSSQRKAALTGAKTNMNESISEIQRLLQEVADHLKSGTQTDTRKAVAKLERIAALALTFALTIRARR
jgi:hypothetical protein